MLSRRVLLTLNFVVIELLLIGLSPGSRARLSLGVLCIAAAGLGAISINRSAGSSRRSAASPWLGLMVGFGLLGVSECLRSSDRFERFFGLADAVVIAGAAVIFVMAIRLTAQEVGQGVGRLVELLAGAGALALLGFAACAEFIAFSGRWPTSQARWALAASVAAFAVIGVFWPTSRVLLVTSIDRVLFAVSGLGVGAGMLLALVPALTGNRAPSPFWSAVFLPVGAHLVSEIGVSRFSRSSARAPSRRWISLLTPTSALGLPVALAVVATRLDHLDGRLLAVAVALALAAGFVALAVLRGERRSLGVSHQATHDPLTGLPNREMYSDMARTALARARRAGERAAVLFIDLDGFKQVNDTLGHAAGDRLLVEVGKRLRGSLRAEDGIARISGDEFAAVLPSIRESGDAALVASKLLRGLNEPVKIGRHEIKVNASIGVALYPDHGISLDQLLPEADSAMYKAKAAGKNRIHLAGENVSGADELLESVREASRTGEGLSVEYEPRVSMRFGCIVAVVARLKCEKLAKSHDELLELATRAGCVSRLELWLVEKAVGQFGSWSTQEGKGVRLVLPLGGRVVADSTFPDAVLSVLDSNRVAASSVTIELEVGARFSSGGPAAAALDRSLKKLAVSGVTLSLLWDVQTRWGISELAGSAFSSLAVDVSGHDDLRPVIAVARSLGWALVFVGAQDRGAYETAYRNGADELQGGLYADATSLESVSALLGLESVMGGQSLLPHHRGDR